MQVKRFLLRLIVFRFVERFRCVYNSPIPSWRTEVWGPRKEMGVCRIVEGRPRSNGTRVWRVGVQGTLGSSEVSVSSFPLLSLVLQVYSFPVTVARDRLWSRDPGVFLRSKRVYLSLYTGRRTDRGNVWVRPSKYSSGQISSMRVRTRRSTRPGFIGWVSHTRVHPFLLPVVFNNEGYLNLKLVVDLYNVCVFVCLCITETSVYVYVGVFPDIILNITLS